MRQTHAATLALILAVFGWMLSLYGILTQLGDPSPLVSSAEIDVHRRSAQAVLASGIIFLLSAIWFSGYGYTSARWRASVALLVVILPCIGILLWLSLGATG